MSITELARQVKAADTPASSSRWRLLILNDLWARDIGSKTAGVEVTPDDTEAIALLNSANAARADEHRWTVKSSNWTQFIDAGFIVVVGGFDADSIIRDLLVIVDYLSGGGIERFTAGIDGQSLNLCRDVAEREPPPGTFTWGSPPEVFQGLVLRDVWLRPARSRRREPGEKNWVEGRSASTLVVPNQSWNAEHATHRVIWEDGNLRFPDHLFGVGTVEAEAFAAIVGNPDCGCQWVLDAWRSGTWTPSLNTLYRLDDRFVGALEARSEAATFREELAFETPDDPLEVGLIERARRRSRIAAIRLMAGGVSYRCAGRLRLMTTDREVAGVPLRSRMFDGDGDMRVKVEVSVDEPPTVECAGAGTEFVFRVRPAWWSHHVESVSRMVGVLICDVVEWGGESGGLPVRVVAGRPGPGLSVYPCEAVVSWDESGEGLPVPEMSWVKR